MENILISIIIPCYNDSHYIEHAVNSALAQTYPYKEVIVVDDGSDAATKTVLQKLAPTITKLITQENKGQSTARNVGIQQAEGDYILVFDSDDYFEPTFCEKAVLELKSNNVKLVTSYITRFTDDKNKDRITPHGGDIAAFILNNEATGSAMFRKTDFIAAGGYDQSMRSGFEDWEFYIRLLKDGGKASIIPEYLFKYRLKKDSTTTKANKVKYELLKYIYTKHREIYAAHFDVFTNHLLSKIKREELEKIKKTQSIEFQIGHAFLKPFRWIKSLFK
ncbi:glycosyltransferase family A protein [Flavobacterium sp. GT3R68]|uniref:glycosyltransferase family 2 protein n=1 Tax=Flavobacterium sp. GT3R68 TaxID=2594437 RepID=UPI000F8737AB|nr:glycosyltransferase family A protein [Flavobacterium sp. GT3R68]RTY92269.1 glycosyltransferase family 2 protein [Flavobacterium sp. GSN2]TRW92505.1 glycosyltransferase family 2 protein [Flavobacterium sp. GT3R68]